MRAPPTRLLAGGRQGSSQEGVAVLRNGPILGGSLTGKRFGGSGGGIRKIPLHEVLTDPERVARMCGSPGRKDFGLDAGRDRKGLSRGVDETETSCQNERLTSTETSGHGGRR